MCVFHSSKGMKDEYFRIEFKLLYIIQNFITNYNIYKWMEL